LSRVLIRRAIVLGCALVVLGAACSDSDGSGTSAASTTTAPAPTTRAPATTTTTRPEPASPSALENLILRDVPGGFKLQSIKIADTGPTDLTKAALDDVTCNVGCDARQALTSAGFVDGYQRQWTSVDESGSTVNQDFIYLYEFRTPEGAQQYAQHWRETLLTSAQGAQVVGFTPAFIPGAVGLRVSDRLGSTGVAIFAKGPYAVRAVVNGGPNVDQSGPVTALASLQHQQLP
jgi:hypothetical protein